MKTTKKGGWFCIGFQTTEEARRLSDFLGIFHFFVSFCLLWFPVEFSTVFLWEGLWHDFSFPLLFPNSPRRITTAIPEVLYKNTHHSDSILTRCALNSFLKEIVATEISTGWLPKERNQNKINKGQKIDQFFKICLLKIIDSLYIQVKLKKKKLSQINRAVLKQNVIVYISFWHTIQLSISIYVAHGIEWGILW